MTEVKWLSQERGGTHREMLGLMYKYLSGVIRLFSILFWEVITCEHTSIKTHRTENLKFGHLCKLQFKKIKKHLNKYIKKFQTSKVKWTSLFKNLSDLQYANACCKFQKGGRGNWPRMLNKPTSVCPQLGREPLQAHLGICWGTGPWMWEGFFLLLFENKQWQPKWHAITNLSGAAVARLLQQRCTFTLKKKKS